MSTTHAPPPFAHVLHRDKVQALAGSRIFARGEVYFREGRVSDLARAGGRISARVRGSEPYACSIWIKGDGLAYVCTCPFGADGGFCKHCVAMALAWLDRAG